MVGSTQLSEQLDPEDYRSVVRAYQESATAVIGEYKGYVAQLTGDGLVVYFGFPDAHEHDAASAILSARGIIESLEDLNFGLMQKFKVRVAVRIGIHSGTVVFGVMGGRNHRERLASGIEVNIAARLEGLANPNTVVISDDTLKLVPGQFITRDLGLHTPKGAEQRPPLRVHEVVDLSSDVRTSVDAAGETPFVGREQELAILVDRWERCLEGRGQTVLLFGDAGLGKSRLARLLRGRLDAQHLNTWLECRCSPYSQSRAFAPVIELLQEEFALKSTDSPAEQVARVERGVDLLGLSNGDTGPLLMDLLSLQGTQSELFHGMDPGIQRKRTLLALVAGVLALAERRPLVVMVEDLHWCDSSTLELIGIMIAQMPAARVLMILTYRSEFAPPSWSTFPHVSHVRLLPMRADEAKQIVANMTPGMALPDPVAQKIIASSDGIPLHIEELTKTVLEAGVLQERGNRFELARPLDELAIPTTLQGILRARLGGLDSETREFAQACAVFGESLSYRLLKEVLRLDDTTLQGQLAKLVDRWLLFPTGLPPESTYRFHSLVCRAAYESLLRSRRRELHGRIAQALVEQCHEIGDTRPELVAHHFSRAAEHARAIRYWHRAGTKALGRSAYAEAAQNFASAEELLPNLQEDPERDRQELDLRLDLGPALMAGRSFAAPAVEDNYARALVLCRRLGEPSGRMFQSLVGSWAGHLQAARLDKAMELARTLDILATSAGDLASVGVADILIGVTSAHFGVLSDALERLNRALSLRNWPELENKWLLDIGVLALSYVALAQWHLGHPNQALATSEKALKRAREVTDTFTRSYALYASAADYQYRGDVGMTRSRAEEALGLLHDSPITLWQADAIMLVGWALAQQGELDAGIAEMRNGIPDLKEARLLLPYWLCLLAEALGASSQIDEALSLIDDALRAVEATGEALHAAELHRVRGELLLKQSSSDGDPDSQATDEAVACFRKAIEVAQDQSAKSLELRAVTSLARLYKQQGHTLRARELLNNSIEWFSEGHDTGDLVAAKQLAADLAPSKLD